MRDSDVLDKNPQISRSALEALHGPLFGWALSRCDFDRAVAEDLVQQTYVELLSGRALFGGQSSLKTFVFGVVQNLSKGRYRRLASRLRLARSLKENSHGQYVVETVDPQGFDVWTLVQDLPGRQRDIIELVFCRELTLEEASTVMGVTTGTGRVHYDRAKKALKIKLENSGIVFYE